MVSYEFLKVRGQSDLDVLILVVVDNGLVPSFINLNTYYYEVLILVVVDNGLVLNKIRKDAGLNELS